MYIHWMYYHVYESSISDCGQHNERRDQRKILDATRFSVCTRDSIRDLRYWKVKDVNHCFSLVQLRFAYDRGVWTNLKEILGPNPLFWMLPIPNHPKSSDDGYSYPPIAAND
jgi:hypothetical protein